MEKEGCVKFGCGEDYRDCGHDKYVPPKPPKAVRREHAWRGEPGSAAYRGEPIYNRESYFRQ